MSFELVSNLVWENLNIRYSLPEGDRSAITLFDAAGRSLYSTTLYHKKEVIEISTRDFPKGVYFVQLKTLNHVAVSRKLVVVK